MFLLSLYTFTVAAIGNVVCSYLKASLVNAAMDFNTQNYKYCSRRLFRPKITSHFRDIVLCSTLFFSYSRTVMKQAVRKY